MTFQGKAVAVLGLGSMGAALAHIYTEKGFELHTWNRTRERKEVEDLIQAGAKMHDSPSAAIQNAQIIIICVLNYDAIYVMLENISKGTFSGGKTIVNLTNGTPKEARAMSRQMKDLDVSTYFDGGIMATPFTVGSEQAFVFYSGELQSRLEEIQDVISPLGRIEYVGEDPGAAALHDLALLSGMYGMLSGAMTAIALLGKTTGGKDKLSTIVEANLVPWMQALLPTVTGIAQRIQRQDFAAHGHPNSMRHSSLSNLMQGCTDDGVEPGALRFLTEAVGETVREGHGEMGFALVARKFLDDESRQFSRF